MIALLLAAVVVLFFITGPDGEPILTREDFKPEVTLPAVSDLLDEHDQEDQSQVTRVYKWPDENGVWQFSNRAEDANGAEIIELDGIINTMAPLSVVERNSAVATGQNQTSPLPALTTAPLSQALDTLDKARHMQETMDNRKTELDKAIVTD